MLLDANVLLYSFVADFPQHLAVRAWLETQLNSRQRLGAIFAGLAGRHQITGDLVMDLSLAALAEEHGLCVVSTDTDFARFPQSRWLNPLA